MTTTPATEIQRRLNEAVIDMINEFRLQRAAGPLPDKATTPMESRRVAARWQRRYPRCAKRKDTGSD